MINSYKIVAETCGYLDSVLENQIDIVIREMQLKGIDDDAIQDVGDILNFLKGEIFKDIRDNVALPLRHALNDALEQVEELERDLERLRHD